MLKHSTTVNAQGHVIVFCKANTKMLVRSQTRWVGAKLPPVVLYYNDKSCVALQLIADVYSCKCLTCKLRKLLVQHGAL